MQRLEEATHRAIANFLRVSLPKPWLFFHPPNGSRRGKAEGGVLKMLGMRAGLPDLFVIGPQRVLCLEVKAPKGSLTPAQADAIEALAACGIPTVVVRSLEEAERFLREQGVPLRGRAL